MSDPAFEAIKKARNQDQGGNPEGAAKTLEDYLATDPYNVPPRMELARIYNYSLKNRKMALIQLDMILDLDPDNVDALKASTTIKMLDKAKTEEADAEFKRLIALVSESKDPKDFAAVCAVYAVFQRKQKVDFEKAAGPGHTLRTAGHRRLSRHVRISSGLRRPPLERHKGLCEGQARTRRGHETQAQQRYREEEL